MNGITELAQLFKDRDNQTEYSPIFGTIINLPNLAIRINEKIILTKNHIKSCIDLYEQDYDRDYVYLGKEVLLLPYFGMQKFVVIGVIV